MRRNFVCQNCQKETYGGHNRKWCDACRETWAKKKASLFKITGKSGEVWVWIRNNQVVKAAAGGEYVSPIYVRKEVVE